MKNQTKHTAMKTVTLTSVNISQSLKLKTMKTFFQTFVAIFFSLLMTACGSKDKNVIVLLDISQSIDVKVREWYLQTIEKDICSALTKYDRITILPIDGATQTAAKPLMEINLEDASKEWNKITGLNTNETNRLRKEASDKFIKEKMQELMAAVQSAAIGRVSASGNTDILGALKATEGYYNSNSQNVLVIMSDMEQYGNKLKMNTSGNCNNWLKEAGAEQYEHLKDFQIAIITGEQLEMPVDYYAKISTFWKEYLTRKGALNLLYTSAEVNGLRSKLSESN